MLIDLERGQPVALLPDREATTLTQWLQAHPGVTVITRDRSRAYAEGARLGAPTALQVADRFHLLQNLAEALDQVFNIHGQVLKAVNDTLSQAPVMLPDGTMAVPVPPHPLRARPRSWPTNAEHGGLALHQQVWALHRQGCPGHAIATQLGIGKNTVFRYLRTTTFPERRQRSDRGRSVLTPYKAYFLERWNAGCRDALRLYREIQQCGYPREFRHRRTLYAASTPGAGPGTATPAPSADPAGRGGASVRRLTARRATWLVLRRPETQDEDEAEQLAQLKAQHPEVATAIVFAQGFARLVRARA